MKLKLDGQTWYNLPNLRQIYFYNLKWGKWYINQVIVF